MATRIQVYEVGPRDGLQNERRVVPTPDKLRLLALLGDAGLTRVEATSFVSPQWIPPLADAAEVVAGLPVRPGLVHGVLVPNARGLERLTEALSKVGAPKPALEIAVFLSASESHNRKNLNRPVEESLAGLEALVPDARRQGLPVRGYVSTAFGCPYEGRVEEGRVEAIVDRLLSAGCYQVSLGDTIGVGTPGQTRRLLERLMARMPPDKLALHMHDTHGTALANVLVGLEAGLTTFDASVGGLGGCPFSPQATGNIATEDLVWQLERDRVATGVDLDALLDVSRWLSGVLGRQLDGQVHRAARWPA